MIGVLSLQGNFAMHIACLKALGASTLEVRTPLQLANIKGLIIPGGESSVMLKLLLQDPLWIPMLQNFFHERKPILGTCAGIILLAKEVAPPQESLNFLDISVARNAYGRQLDSHNVEVEVQLGVERQKIILPFIRAPKITRIGSNVKVLAMVDHEPVMVEEAQVLGATCHPEATSTLLHQYFLNKC